MKRKRTAVLTAVLMSGLLTVSAFAAGPGHCIQVHAHSAACPGVDHCIQYCPRVNKCGWDTGTMPAFRPTSGVPTAPAALPESVPAAPAYEIPYGGHHGHHGGCHH